MRGVKEKGFGERLSTAADAKKAALDRFRTRPPADDPAVLERQASRQAVALAREARAAERTAARLEKEARDAEEKRAREAAEAEQRDREITERIEREAALDLERKVARDARYAARKARK